MATGCARSGVVEGPGAAHPEQVVDVVGDLLLALGAKDPDLEVERLGPVEAATRPPPPRVSGMLEVVEHDRGFVGEGRLHQHLVSQVDDVVDMLDVHRTLLDAGPTGGARPEHVRVDDRHRTGGRVCRERRVRGIPRGSNEGERGEGAHVVGEGVAGLGCGGEVGRLGERVITHGHHQKLGRQRFSGVPGRALALAATAFGAGGEVEEALPGEVLDFADAHEVVLARVLEVDLFAARIDGQEGAQGAGPAREGDIREGREDVQVLAVGDEHGESEEDGESEEQEYGFEDFVRVRAEGAQRTGQPLGGKGTAQELEGPIGVIARV